MSVPHDTINFNLRVNKRIERRMIVDVLAGLARYENPSRFGYIGMGSYYFADFAVMHKVLGIDKMVSIEWDRENDFRYEFNKPFACIEIVFGSTHDVLPTLKIFQERPVIVWLDYYGSLSDAVLGDVQEVITKCKPGSALIITLNGKALIDAESVAQFESNLSARNRPPSYRNYSPSDKAQPDKFAEICRQVLTMRLQAVCSDRNAVNHEIGLRQIFNFRYKDGVRMLTFGWIFPNAEQAKHIDRNPSAMRAYPISVNGTPVNIDAPALTFREIAHLRAQLPKKPSDQTFLQKAQPIQGESAEKFASLYRYFPSFANIEE